jgi:sec-independent protein translocase protein TatC
VQLVGARRYVIVAIFIAAAVITPPDVISQFALAVPLLALFEGTLLLMRINEGRAARNAPQEPEAEGDPASEATDGA